MTTLWPRATSVAATAKMWFSTPPEFGWKKSQTMHTRSRSPGGGGGGGDDVGCGGESGRTSPGQSVAQTEASVVQKNGRLTKVLTADSPRMSVASITSTGPMDSVLPASVSATAARREDLRTIPKTGPRARRCFDTNFKEGGRKLLFLPARQPTADSACAFALCHPALASIHIPSCREILARGARNAAEERSEEAGGQV